MFVRKHYSIMRYTGLFYVRNSHYTFIFFFRKEEKYTYYLVRKYWKISSFCLWLWMYRCNIKRLTVIEIASPFSEGPFENYNSNRRRIKKKKIHYEPEKFKVGMTSQSWF